MAVINNKGINATRRYKTYKYCTQPKVPKFIKEILTYMKTDMNSITVKNFTQVTSGKIIQTENQ